MTRLEDTFGIRRSNALLPTHNLTVNDNHFKLALQKFAKTVVENILIFLLSSKLKLENVIQNYRLALPMHNDNKVYLNQSKSMHAFSNKEKIISAISSKFNTQEIACLCLSVPLLIILGFLTILRPTFKTEENHIEETVIYNNYSPDLRYYIHSDDNSNSHENRFLMTDKLYTTKKNSTVGSDTTRKSVRYNVVGINSLMKTKSRQNLLFKSSLFHPSAEA
mgnify:FL=1